ncbi:MAG: MFS transporter, partial [Myxococcales bacterium]|nr:MFS transporter [Myxococcales bacterium]
LEDLLFGAIQISGLFSVPLVVAVARRTQKHTAYALLMGSWAALLLVLAMAPRGVWQITLVMMILAGPGMAAAHVLPWSMLPDVVDADTAANGTDRAGAFYGAMTFLEKVGTALALQSAMLALQLGGYEARAPTQSDMAIDTLALVIGPLPGAVLAAACLLAWLRPPVTRAELEAMQA